MNPIIDPIAQLMRRIEEIERRQRRQLFAGKVTDVDAAKRRVRVSDGLKDDTGQPVKTTWLPWAELAGGLKSKTLPTVGQQVMVACPSGLMENGMVFAGFFTDSNPKPDADDEEYILTNGKIKISIKDQTWTLKNGEISIVLDNEKIVLKVNETEIELKAETINAISKTIFLVGATHSGVGARNEPAIPKVLTDAGPAEQSFAKV
jgi:phage baseplate assembly protein V